MYADGWAKSVHGPHYHLDCHRHHGADHHSYGRYRDARIGFFADAWRSVSVLDLLLSTSGDKQLYIKGIVGLMEDPALPLVIHGVQKIRQLPTRLPSGPDSVLDIRLVLINIDLPRDYAERLLLPSSTSLPSARLPARRWKTTLWQLLGSRPKFF